MDDFGIKKNLVWLKEEPDSKQRTPYLEFSDRYGRTWYVPLKKGYKYV